MAAFFMLAITSPRLTSTPVTLQEEQEILRIYAENESILPLLDRDQDASQLTTRLLHHSNVPKGGRQDHLHNLLLHAGNHPIGLLSVYIGYPQPDIAYIGELFLRPQFQQQGFAAEAVKGLETELIRQAYTGIRVGVSLKNWRGLRFWLRQKFLAVTGMSGDRDFGPEAHAFIELHKRLTRKDGIS